MNQQQRTAYAAELLRKRRGGDMGCLAKLLLSPIVLALLAGGCWWMWLMLPYLPDAIAQLGPAWRAAAIAFAAGLVLFSFVHLTPIYVFGHELTHWIAAKLFRRRTGAFRVGLKGGSVQVDNPNAAIILAPYCVPLYFLLSMAIVAGLAVLRPQWCDTRNFAIAAGGWLGLCYAYHLVLTACALYCGQSDLKHCGWLLSMMLILACNVLFFDLFVFLIVDFQGRLLCGV